MDPSVIKHGKGEIPYGGLNGRIIDITWGLSGGPCLIDYRMGNITNLQKDRIG